MADKLRDTFRFFIVPLDVLKDKGLTIYEKMVYMVLRSFVNPHNDSVWPSYNQIAELSSMSRRKAITVIEALIQKGYIEREYKFDYNPQQQRVMNENNRYTLKLPSAPDAPPANLVHDMHHPSAHGAPPLVHTVHHPSAHGAPELELITRTNKLKDDDDRLRHISSVFERFQDQITEEQFKSVVKRVETYERSGAVGNFEAVLVTAVQKEIAKIQTAASRQTEAPTRSRSRSSGSKRPPMPVVADTPSPEITPEERAKMRELAARLRADS